MKSTLLFLVSVFWAHLLPFHRSSSSKRSFANQLIIIIATIIILSLSFSTLAAPLDVKAPTVQIDSRNLSTTYTSAQSIIIKALARDSGSGVSKVEFYKNNILYCTDTAIDYSCIWSITSADNGTHTWKAKAYDFAGNYSAFTADVQLIIDIPLPLASVPVAITNPAENKNNTTIKTSQQVTIAAEEYLSQTVSKIEFYKNNALFCTDISAPYNNCTWNVTSLDNGNYSLLAKAYDINGKTYDSAPVNVSVQISPPTVSITNPTSGSYNTAQTITISANAIDDIGVNKVEFYKNNVLYCTDMTSGYSCAWSFTCADQGNHKWEAKAYDNEGNLSTSTPVNLIIDCTSPIISISSTSANTITSAQTITITAQDSDNSGSGVVTKVDFYLDGKLYCADTTSPHSCAWNVTSADNSNTSRIWDAIAYDQAGNRGYSNKLNFYVNIAANAGGTPIDAYQYGGSGTDQGHALARANNGELAITGIYANTVDFGTGPLSCTNTVNMFVAKYDANNHPLWANCITKSTGSSGTIYPNDISIDTAGNVLIVGSFNGTMQLGQQSITSWGGTSKDIFIAKFSSSDGSLIWFQRIGDVGEDRAFGVTIDNFDYIVITGEFVSPQISSSIFITKYAPDGTQKWIRSFSGYGTHQGKSVKVDANNNIVFAGEYNSELRDEKGTLLFKNEDPLNVNPDLILAKLDQNGNLLWAKSATGTGAKIVNHLDVNPGTGDIVISGYVSGDWYTNEAVNFGGGAISGDGTYNAFLVKYDANGNFGWQRIILSTGSSIGYGAAFDPLTGDVFWSATFPNSANFGGATFISMGSSDIAFARYRGTTGEHLWSKSFGSTGNDTVKKVVFDEINNTLTATGNFYNTINFGSKSLTSKGVADIFVLELNP